MNRLVLAHEAERDGLEAFQFYEVRREGLGERFRDHLGVALGKVQVSAEVCSGYLSGPSPKIRGALSVCHPLSGVSGHCLRRRDHARQAEPRHLEAARDP